MATDTNDPSPLPESETPQARAAQDRRIAKDISLSEQQIKAGAGEVEAAPELAEGGYTPEVFATVATPLQVEALNKFAARQAADGAKTAATAAVKTAEKSVRTLYTKDRDLGRSAFQKDAAAREALGLAGRAPQSLDELITAARTLAKEGPGNQVYAARLASKAVTAAKLTQLSTAVDALVEANLAQEAAIAAAPQATKERDLAYQALKAWMSEYRAFAKAQLKDRPDVLKRLLLA